MYSITLFFIFITGTSGLKINVDIGDVQHFSFLKYFSAVRSVLMMDLEGDDFRCGDIFLKRLMDHGKTPCIVSPFPNDTESNKTLVNLTRTYLINRGRNTGLFISMSTPKTKQLISSDLKNALIPLMRNPTIFLFYGMNKNNSKLFGDIRPKLEDFFETIWTVMKIPNALGAVLTLSGDPILCTYDTHQWSVGHSRGIRFFTQEQIINDQTIVENESLYQHYRLKISFFERYPTSFKINDPQPALFKRLAKNSWGYGGLDGFLMGDAVKAIRMNATLHDLGPGQPYGYINDDGTIGGSLGEIVNMKADIAFNSRFVKGYGIDNGYEYLGYIHSDRLCLIVPKAGWIPIWQNVGRVYSTGVWSLLLVQTLAISVLRWLQLNLLRRRIKSLLFVTMETHAVILVPVAKANRAPPRERLLLVLCLLINLILVSLFQGNLHAAYNAREPYPDIDTMEELDECGYDLSISPGFRDVFDVFEDSSTPAYIRLSSKLHYEHNGRDLIDSIAEGARIATLARESDIKLDIRSNYIGPTGEPLLHVVHECPRNFKLAYIVSKNFPFKKNMNDAINRLVEAGLPEWYYDMTAYVMTLQARALRPEHARTAHAALRLQHITGAFYILAAGTTLALVSLAVEMAVARRKRARTL